MKKSKSLNLGSVMGLVQLPLAKSSIRESDSVIRARDGDVVVIGGLMKSNTSDVTSKVPFFRRYPCFGAFVPKYQSIDAKDRACDFT